MSLREKLSQLPNQSGVYLMKDQKGQIIYVGKAKNLRSRVQSYFRDQTKTIKTKALVLEISDFDLILTKTEVEALLLERNLIRHHQPHYNVLLRDDKEYPYIRVNFKEPWPRIQKVRKRKDDGAVYLGPFANASMLHILFKTVHRIFPLIRCSQHEFKAAKRPCNYYHMKMCLAPCTLPVDRDEYVKMVESALRIFEGKNSEVRKQIEQRMHEAAANESFELAAQYRDQIQAMEQIAQRQVAVSRTQRNADAIALVETNGVMAFSVTMVRDRTIIGNENFVVGSTVEEAAEALASFILQYYARRPAPETILIPQPIEHAEELVQVLAADPNIAYLPRFVIGQRGEAKDLIDMARDNAKLHVEQLQSLQLRQKAELEILQKLIGLEAIPRRIECIDISNTQEAAIVAACVCFIDGKPAKDHYRRYQVEGVQGRPDDFASMREVVYRRLAKGLEEDNLPDLLVIDGGKGQLSAALEAKAEFPKLQLAVISLAKSRSLKAANLQTERLTRSFERIFLPGRIEPIFLEVESPAYRILTRVRDEAHRFAISFHRKKRQQLSHASALDSIPGVGPVLKKRLLERFGGTKGIRDASLEQLQTVPGVHEKLALLIYTTLQELTN